jgi:hypothetical protein
MVATTAVPALEVTPVIVDLGKRKRKQIKNLKKGSGKLLAEVAEVLSEVRSNLGSDLDGGQLIPVVLIYKRKSKRRRGGGRLRLPFPFLG